MLNRYEPLLTFINHCKPFLTTCFNRFLLIDFIVALDGIDTLWLFKPWYIFGGHGHVLSSRPKERNSILHHKILYETCLYCWMGESEYHNIHICPWFPTQCMCFVYDSIYIYIIIYMRVQRLAMIQLSKAFHIPYVFSRFNRPRRRVHFRSSSKEHEILWYVNGGIREKTRQVILEIISTLHPSYRNHFWSHLLRRSWHPLNVSKCTIIASTENSHSRCIQWASGLPRTVL